MSYSSSLSAFDHYEFFSDKPVARVDGQPSKSGWATDGAIDAALRSVPLPQGLMTRLGKLVYTMPDESADHMDWLGF